MLIPYRNPLVERVRHPLGPDVHRPELASRFSSSYVITPRHRFRLSEFVMGFFRQRLKLK